MKLAQRIFDWLNARFDGVQSSREPDLVIGDPKEPYLLRWWLIPKNRFFNVYLHEFLRSDHDFALHDHPWWNLSILVRGRYTEHTIKAGGVNVRTERKVGDFKFRTAKAAHRIELSHGTCRTVFITGPLIRQWGFHCPMGWRPWPEFTKPGSYGEIGKGCDD